MSFRVINISSFFNKNSRDMKLFLCRTVNNPAMSTAVGLYSLIICTFHKIAINYCESNINVIPNYFITIIYENDSYVRKKFHS